MKNTGIELWEKAKKLIPGGNQLLSKRSEMFFPEQWPSYYKKAKGCEIWDLDENHYYDFAQMGVGSCVLGYSDKDVDQKVKFAIDNGSMATLNSYEEVEFAEKILSLHPWAQMARFARTGGEACSIAVRIGRAASGKDKIAFCGYHGWHDWYLASNIGDNKNLNDHLLPGLLSKGVPRQLRDTAIPFHYNNLKELEEIVTKYSAEIGVIIMEPVRSKNPESRFLKGVRDIANRINAVLIFDEVTSGFRMNLGGIHLMHGIFPDIAVFGKAIGNGYPIAAIIGKREVMDIAQESFISSTFWTERVGYAAAMATIEKMEKNKVQKYLVNYGDKINKGWKKIAEENDVKIKISGIPPLTHITFNYDNALEIQTLYTQEMLKNGYLAGAAVYTTYAYSESIIENFIDKSNIAFRVIKKGLENNNISCLLEGPVRHSGFARLT